MVVMYSKAKKTPAPGAAAASTPAAAPAVAEPPAAAPPAAPEAPAAAPAPSATPVEPAVPAPPEFAPDHEAAISNLCEMGFPRDEVIAAMRAAFMNADRAVEYLTNGIPEALLPPDGMEVEEGEGGEEEATPSTWAELAASPSFLMEVSQIRDQTQLQSYLAALQTTNPEKLALIRGNAQEFAALLNSATAGAAAPGGAAAAAPTAPVPALPFGAAPEEGAAGGGAGIPAGLQALLSQRPEMLEGIMQNPEALRQLLQAPEVQAMLQNPEVQEQLGINPEMMQAMMHGMNAQNQVQAQLTDEDEEAIQRLMALGFQRAIVIQAFLACDKNENLAANFLFDQGGDLM